MHDGRFETILKTILQENPSKEEIERRLQAVIDEELSGPLMDMSADMELVQKCQSLLWTLKTNGAFPYPDHAQENKQKLLQKLQRPASEKKQRLVYRLAVAAAAAVLVLGLGLISLRRYCGNSTPDGQQYIIKGHEITTEMVARAIAKHGAEGQFITSSKEEAENYLGFEIPVPSQLLGKYTCDQYYVHMLPFWAQSVSIYTHNELSIRTTVYYLTNVKDSVLVVEQNSDGDDYSINGEKIYISKNVDQTLLTWIEDNVVYCVSGNFDLEQGVEISKEIKGVKK
ncbi:MAG: hypothetical protein IJN44_04430 [Clostridia bacterium]|nr:hypothetical protein [Clostridia bacterium]